jgi:hypothetical protein
LYTTSIIIQIYTLFAPFLIASKDASKSLSAALASLQQQKPLFKEYGLIPKVETLSHFQK